METGIVTAILNGAADDNLDAIVDAVRTRRTVVSQITAATLKPGDKVRIVGNISPKYLLGLVGEVSGPAQGERVPVQLGPEAGRYAGIAKTPASCLEKLEDAR